MQRLPTTAAFVLALLAAPVLGTMSHAADPPSLAGRWQGTLKLGSVSLDYDIDFTRKGSGLSGDISIPAQGARDLPLEAISLDGDLVAFKLNGLPGNPSFKGTLSADGATIQGTFTRRPVDRVHDGPRGRPGRRDEEVARGLRRGRREGDP
jgi:hypothetical protein